MTDTAERLGDPAYERGRTEMLKVLLVEVLATMPVTERTQIMEKVSSIAGYIGTSKGEAQGQGAASITESINTALSRRMM